jgi:DNA-binding transcriptional regulator LsrR (DeoR family)
VKYSNSGIDNFKLSAVAHMYFKMEMSQSEIAEKLGLSKVAVSRMLQKAKKQNIYQINITLPFHINEDIADRLKKRYALDNVIVVKNPQSNGNVSISRLIGMVWAYYMSVSLKDNCTFGIGIGHTIGYFVDSLIPMKTDGVHIVQLQGGLTDVDFYNPFTITQKACQHLKTKGTYITSSAIVDTKEQRDSIIEDPPIGKPIKEMWKKCDKAIFGIGLIDKGTFIAPNVIGTDKIEEIKNLGVIGNIMGHCLDINGKFIATEIDEKLVSIPIEILKTISERIALAGGKQKASAIRSALLSGIVTTLVTDESAAELVLHEN